MIKLFAERRAHPRIPAEDHPGLIDYTPVRVLDLSFCGALIETDSWLVPGEHLALRIEPGIQLGATVVRCSIHRGDTQGRRRSRLVHRVGVLFDPPDELVRRQLLLLLRALGRAASQSPPVELAIAR